MITWETRNTATSAEEAMQALANVTQDTGRANDIIYGSAESAYTLWGRVVEYAERFDIPVTGLDEAAAQYLIDHDKWCEAESVEEILEDWDRRGWNASYC